ncbi:MAG: alpha/beta hydrolase [Rhodospirillaceae bacterium]|nr:alpha/beta hydrolase [Rhodospirillaceae bacterium]
MFKDFEIKKFPVPNQGFGSATINARIGGAGPPILLIHGNPLTHFSWHKVAPLLKDKFKLICVDLRGYGDSLGPEDGGAESINYSFRAMAADLIVVMQELGYDSFFVAGHDRGARTAHRMALDHEESVKKLALIDILPSHYIWNHTSAKWANSSWHWLFMAQPYDMPEQMMANVPADYFIEKKLSKPGKGLMPFAPEALSEYVRCFNWKTIRASCEDYRACASSDLKMDTADFENELHIKCPTLTIWGKESHTGEVYGDLIPIWRNYIDGKLTGGGINCGHYVIEEKPQETAEYLTKHFIG